MKILFGKEEIKYYRLQSLFTEHVALKVLNTELLLKEKLERVEKQCDGGKHDFELVLHNDAFGTTTVTRLCRKCVFTDRREI